MATHALITSKHRPSLRERVSTLKTRAARAVRRRTTATITDLHRAYADAQLVRPIFEEEIELTSVRYRTANAVDQRMRKAISAILTGPAPTSAADLSVVALASAIYAEGMAQPGWGDNAREMAATARALVIATGIVLPGGFLGFGDEPGFVAREQALLANPGRLPG